MQILGPAGGLIFARIFELLALLEGVMNRVRLVLRGSIYLNCVSNVNSL